MPATVSRGVAGRSLPPILRAGDQVKVPTKAGMAEWRQLRESFPAFQVDRIVYADDRIGQTWEPKAALVSGGVR